MLNQHLRKCAVRTVSKMYGTNVVQSEGSWKGK